MKYLLTIAAVTLFTTCKTQNTAGPNAGQPAKQETLNATNEQASSGSITYRMPLTIVLRSSNPAAYKSILFDANIDSAGKGVMHDVGGSAGSKIIFFAGAPQEQILSADASIQLPGFEGKHATGAAIYHTTLSRFVSGSDVCSTYIAGESGSSPSASWGVKIINEAGKMQIRFGDEQKPHPRNSSDPAGGQVTCTNLEYWVTVSPNS